jgi:hypothetical protein
MTLQVTEVMSITFTRRENSFGSKAKLGETPEIPNVTKHFHSWIRFHPGKIDGLHHLRNLDQPNNTQNERH